MTKLTIDSDLRAKLANLEDLVELCDESGRVVGFFHPVASMSGTSKQPISPVSDDEIEVARKQRTGRPLADILRDLDRQS